ncbi:MAG: sulfate ABC transporter ATP-binding protein [Acidobacteria bacterium]|nr:sulfate ABC transporter ATP-binding protein [Acidobacteriota bacterium]
MSIEIRDIQRTIGGFAALRGVSLAVETGELVALVGPSGSGKTSLLRIIAGLDQPDAGSIHLSGEDASARHVRDRRVGFVFQHYALFKHMTVAQNVAFGLTVRPRAERPPAKEIRERVTALLSLVQLEYLAERYPSQLSGGQRQRVALARALAVEPRVLLLDEPFGSLDAAVRIELRRWLRRLHDDLHVTSVFVTHDQEEAFEVADRIVVMNQGLIEQIGTPQEVFDHPATPFVMSFLGTTNIFHGRIQGGKAHLGRFTVDVAGRGEARGAPPQAEAYAAGYVRPHELEVATEASAAGGLWTTLERANVAGTFVKLELLDEDGRSLHAHVSREVYGALAASEGDRLYVTPRTVRIFPGEEPVSPERP